MKRGRLGTSGSAIAGGRSRGAGAWTNDEANPKEHWEDEEGREGHFEPTGNGEETKMQGADLKERKNSQQEVYIYIKRVMDKKTTDTVPVNVRTSWWLDIFGNRDAKKIPELRHRTRYR